MTEIPDRPLNKIAIDLVTNCETSTSGKTHPHYNRSLNRDSPKAFPIPDKSADTIVATFINDYLTSAHVPPTHFV